MIGVILVVLSVYIRSLSAGYGVILSVEHLEDILFRPGETVARTGAVLVLYTPECPPPVMNMERDHVQLYLIHDYETASRTIWHKYDSRTLHDRYSNGECLSAVYLEKGKPIDQPTARWDSGSGLSIVDWFWGFLKHDIKITNNLDAKISITHMRHDEFPHVPDTIIEPAEEVTIFSYVSYTLIFKVSGEIDIIDSLLVMSNTSSFIIEGKSDVSTADLILQDNADLRHMNDFVWDHTDRHLRNIKQPLIVHNYTEHGYEKMQMPVDLYSTIHRFYKEKKHVAVDESSAGSVISSNITKAPTLVQLSDEIMMTIENALKPLLEKWCKCSLHRTAIYGIREYYKGHMLFNHVDRVETHVISAILQIDQDLGGEEDWMLEVITYKGERREVKLLPGEMLFYESAKLVHGRPKLFKGKLFANAFVHFAPNSGWDVKFEGRGFVNHKTGLYEEIDDTSSNVLLNGKVIPLKDEL